MEKLLDKLAQIQIANVQDGSLHVNEGWPINITCTAKGNPRPDYIWKFKDKQLHSVINNTIVISNATLDDAGVYTCTAVNSIGNETINVTLIVNYIRDPNCAAIPSPVEDRNNITMNCSTSGYPPVNYTWTVGNTIPGQIRTITATPSLDGVNVTCKAANKVGIRTCTNTLQVQYKPEQLLITNMQDGSLYVSEGQPINITCTAKGNPRPDYIWKFKDKQLHSAINNTIVISNTTLDDGGMYTCTAVNSIGNETINVTLIVNYLRDAMCGPEIHTVTEGKNVHLNCSAIGFPGANYSWTVDNIVSQGPTEILHLVSRRQNGSMVTCNATNSFGTKTCSKTVIVHYLAACKENQELASEQSSSLFPDGYPEPKVVCSSSADFSLSYSEKRYTLSRPQSNVTCFVNNTVGNCIIHFKVLKQNSIKVVNGTFRCTSCVYQSDLAEKKSPVYKKLKSKIEKMLKLVYAFLKYVTSVTVIGFWPGSVIVEFQLIITADVPDPLLPFKVAACKHGGSLDGINIDVSSIQTGSYILLATSEYTPQSTMTITASRAGSPAASITLGVLFGVSIICNFLLVAYTIFWHRKQGNNQNPRARSSKNDKGEVLYMNSMSLQDNPSKDGQNMMQREPADYDKQQESPDTTIYQSVNPYLDTYSSLSPSTKLPPKPAVMSTSGVYQDLQAFSHQYQSLDEFSQS